jgi:CubicO group peptidase (beta-lactamase class C family)
MDAAQVQGLALGVVQGDRVLHLRGFGAADDSGRAVTPQTPFNIGSVTKSFTAMAVMQLVEKGQIQLDAPVQQYLPWFRLADITASSVVTVRELLNHTSGIRRGAGEDGSLCKPSTTAGDVVRSLAKVRPAALPGRSFQYSDANYMTLGVLVEAVSGQPYADYVQRHILAPLDMTNTFLSGEQALQHSVAVGHGTVAGRPEAAPPGYFCPGYLGASFIVSTAQDMTHWLIAHLNQGRYGSRSVVSAAGIAELHRPGVPTGSLFGPWQWLWNGLGCRHQSRSPGDSARR